jgi:hypothetical protein
MRYREKVNNLEYGYLNNKWVQNGVVLVNANLEFIAQQSYSAMLDVVTPNWREIVAKGGIINNDMLSSIYSLSVVPGIYSCDGSNIKDPSITYSHNYGCVLPAANGARSLDWGYFDLAYLNEYADERGVAIAKAWSNVDVSSIQALASLGELPETLHWMASLVQRAISVLRLFAQKRLLIRAGKTFRSGASIIDAMANFWLELRYAFRPLVMDMRQAVEAWNAVLDKSDRFTARGYNRIPLSTTTSTYTVDDGIVSRVQTEEANFRAGVLFTIDNMSDMMSVWGLDKPIETIWELIPFSFIVDWFFNIGTVIGSWTPKPGLKPLASWCVEEISQQTVDTVLPKNWVDPSKWTIEHYQRTAATTTTKQTVKRRIKSPTRSILPSFNLNLDTAKLIDLAAIGKGIFSSIRRS